MSAAFPFTNDPLSQVELIYIAYFGRAGDPKGINFWVNELTASGDTVVPGLTGVAAAFSLQPEAMAQYPLLANPQGASQADIQAFINAIYQNLFDRSADQKGLAFWTDEVNAILATGDPLQIANGIGQMAVSIALGAQGPDQTVLENKVTASDFLTQTFSDHGINTFPNPSGLFTFAHTDIAGVGVSQDSVDAAEHAAIGLVVLNLTVNGDVTVDMAQEPATIDTIIYQPVAFGSVTINDQTKPLTVNLQDTTNAMQTLTVGAVGPAPGLNDSLTVVIGTPLNGDLIGAMNVMGDELFTLTAVGPSGDNSRGFVDATGLITLTPTLGGNEHVTIGGNATIAFGPGALGSMVDTTAGVLNVNNLTITITNTGETAFASDSVPGTLLNFVSSAPAPSIPYSTNAVTIDASTSGGLFMLAGDANFVPGASTGAVITGASNPLGIAFGTGTNSGDILGGSIGNDIITSKSVTLPDFIFTDGGADKITLAAGHTGADHVAFYAVGQISVSAGGIVMESVPNAISEPVLDTLQFVNPGWWGVAAGDSPKDILSLNSNGTGTSVDNSTLNGFVPGQDLLDFSVSAWGGPAFPVNGLSADNGAALVNISTVAGLSSDTGVGVNAVAVSPGGSIIGSAATSNNFIALAQNSFLDANAVATVLSNGTYIIKHSTAVLNTDYDFLMAYQGLDGNAHIADLHILGNNSTSTNKDSVVGVSDIVTLVGVTLPQLLANDSHIHIVT